MAASAHTAVTKEKEAALWFDPAVRSFYVHEEIAGQERRLSCKIRLAICHGESRVVS